MLSQARHAERVRELKQPFMVVSAVSELPLLHTFLLRKATNILSQAQDQLGWMLLPCLERCAFLAGRAFCPFYPLQGESVTWSEQATKLGPRRAAAIAQPAAPACQSAAGALTRVLLPKPGCSHCSMPGKTLEVGTSVPGHSSYMPQAAGNWTTELPTGSRSTAAWVASQ